MITPGTRTFALAAAGALALASCSTADADVEASLSVSAALYPLQFVAEEVGGELVSVSTLTAPGVEPHDLELSPAAVRGLADANLVLYIGEFQPAVDDAISSSGAKGFDAATIIDFHAAEEHEEGEEGHDHGEGDPHFWLEPALLADYAEAVGAEFAALDPDNADSYTANAEDLAAELRALDDDFAAGLAQCERDEIIVTHEAFGYLAEAFGLHQEGLAGLEPDQEPSPARLLEIKELIAETGATTVFTEVLVSPKVAEALAADAGVATAVLDPVESVADGDDYVGVMERNLDNLRAALDCA